MPATPERAAFVSELFRSATWESPDVRDNYGRVARDTKDTPFESFFDNIGDAQLMLMERGLLLGGHARRFKVVVDRLLLETDVDLSQTVPSAQVIDTDLVADIAAGIVALESVDFDQNKTVVNLWGTFGDPPVSVARAVGHASASGSAGAVPAGNQASRGSASGFATAMGVGQYTTPGQGVGSSSASGSAAAASTATQQSAGASSAAGAATATGQDGAAGAGAHRYWRLFHRQGVAFGSICGITEIEMHTSAGGADVTGSGTATASSERVSEEAPKAFDNNFTSTLWQMNGNGHGSWIQYDYGVGNAFDIQEILIRPDFSDVARTPREIDVQWSDNGSTWTTAWSISYTAWVSGTSVTFTKPTAVNSRYWRLRPDTLQGGGQTMGCAELELRSTVGGADQATGGAAISRTFFAGFPASNAFDNSTATVWSGAAAITGVNQSDWLGYDFGVGITKDIVQMSYTARPSPDHAQAPTAGWAESSPDGINWLSRWTFSGKSYTSLSTSLLP